MNEATPRADRYRVFILVLTLVNTIFAALLSGLQVDANVRADKANRDSQYYALQATHELIRVGYQSAYDFELFSGTVKDAQLALVMELTALELEQEGDEEAAATLRSQSQIAQARSDKGVSLSLLYTDPRYAPVEAGDIPDLEAYLAEQSQAPNDLVAKQNEATDEYHRWDEKADAYIAVLSILAIAFFLLGLAQSTARMRLFFALSALGIMFIAGAWAGFIMLA